MVQPDPATMVGHIEEAIVGLHEHNIGVAKLPALALLPLANECVAKWFEEPAPKLARARKVRHVELNVMEQAGSHSVSLNSERRNSAEAQCLGGLITQLEC